MAQREEFTCKQFQEQFATEEACKNFLYENRFPNGFVCPHCGGKKCSFIRTRWLYQCSSCRKQTSMTAGTVMHRTHLPLTAWFWAMYLCATDKRGISAVQLQKALDICYESAWYLLVRIRSAMGQRNQKYLLSGIVVLHPARNQTRSWAGFPQGCVIVLDGRQPPVSSALPCKNPAPSPNLIPGWMEH